MRTDSLGIPIYSHNDIVELIYEDRANLLENILGDPDDEEIERYNSVSESKIKIYEDTGLDKHEFDRMLQSTWYMPDEYKTYDIVDWLYCECRTVEEKNRVTEELKAFAERDMIMLLKWLKYFVDTCRKEKIIWGVGRGSSVASYVLYLIGVHKINSMQYNLDWREFLR